MLLPPFLPPLPLVLPLPLPPWACGTLASPQFKCPNVRGAISFFACAFVADASSGKPSCASLLLPHTHRLSLSDASLTDAAATTSFSSHAAPTAPSPIPRPLKPDTLPAGSARQLDPFALFTAAGLMTGCSRRDRALTPKGFGLLLKSTFHQLWLLLGQYIRHAESSSGAALASVMSFLMQLGFRRVGEPCSLEVREADSRTARETAGPKGLSLAALEEGHDERAERWKGGIKYVRLWATLARASRQMHARRRPAPCDFSELPVP